MINDAAIFILPLVVNKITRVYLKPSSFVGVYCSNPNKPRFCQHIFMRFVYKQNDRGIYRMFRDCKSEKNYVTYYYETCNGIVYIDFVFKVPSGITKSNIDLIKLGFLSNIFYKCKERILEFWGANITNKLYKILYGRMKYKPTFSDIKNPGDHKDHQGFLFVAAKKI